MTLSIPRALVFMTARNCERYVRAALESLAWQTHPALHVLFVDDCSSDATPAIARRVLDEHFRGRHSFVANPEPWGKARNAHVHLRAAQAHGDFVAVLDGDDQLIMADVLARIAAEYAAGHDVVWTNYETDGGAVGGNGPLDPLQSPRGKGWKTSHFFTFRTELLDGVPEDRFQDERGAWLTAACDFALAYPMLDQTRRYKYLPLRAYRYTASNPASHHNRDAQSAGLNSRAQQHGAAQVLSKPPLPCHRWVFGERAGADEALLALRQQLQAQVRDAARQIEARLAAPPEAVAPPAADGWTQAAAALLAERCPAWLELALDGQGEAMDVRSALRWWRWLQAGATPPRVLEIGAGPLAAPLHAAVRALGGRMLSVCADKPRSLALYARLQAVGVEAEVLHVPMVDVGFDQLEGRFPDLGLLPEDAADFDVLVVSARAGAAPGDALFALPVAASRLHSAELRVCLWAPEDPALRERAAAFWGPLVPELACADHAFHGQALSLQRS